MVKNKEKKTRMSRKKAWFQIYPVSDAGTDATRTVLRHFVQSARKRLYTYSLNGRYIIQ